MTAPLLPRSATTVAQITASTQRTIRSLTPQLIDVLLDEHLRDRLPRMRWLWGYYRNPVGPDASVSGDRGGPINQRHGLPDRLRHPTGAASREVVIENDIAWRVHALADFMFGRPLVVQSLADDPRQAARIDTLIRETFDRSGGESFFHHLALLGSVHGSIDVLVRPGADADPGTRLELIEAPRAVPLLDPGDYRRLDGFLIHYAQQTHDLEASPWLRRVVRPGGPTRRRVVYRTEVWTAETRETFVGPSPGAGGGRCRVDLQPNPLGRVPVVHIQNLAQPLRYDGLSDVEPLIPLQDELNTRLSDRANRVTFQTFKMYLGKGIDGFTDRPVGPGQMWATDNPDAAIHEFGGDAHTPSEDRHVREVREAMDKASGVSPIAAGVVGGKVGNLSSENAIRIVLLGLLARIEKKRLTYGAGITQLCELILHAADLDGTLPNRPEDRRVRLDWPTPFPDSETQQLQNALLKEQLGVPAAQLRAELGYADCPESD
ncbi:MAG: phage portal protein [Planctomycetota bacterium]